jgi:hypothetical protein
MTANQLKSRLPLVALIATSAMLAAPTGAQARPVMLKEPVPSRNLTSVGHPESVAVSPEGDIYVSDGNGSNGPNNNRVQELGPAGEFVLMFGKEVDATTKGDICTAISKDVCQAGVQGAGPGAFNRVSSVAVDPNAPHDVYVQDHDNWRVDKYTAGGAFVLMFGKEVNATKVNEFKEPGNPHKITETEENVCTEAEIKATGVKCQAGTKGTEGVSEPSAFRFAESNGDLLAVGPNHVLYVGDEHRVQEFELSGTGGKYKTDIPLTSISAANGDIVTSLAVDGAADVYLTYGNNGVAVPTAGTVYEFEPDGKEVKTEHFPLTMSPRTRPNQIGPTELSIDTIALDPAGALDPNGLLAVVAREQYAVEEQGKDVLHDEARGTLYEAVTGKRLTNFSGRLASDGTYRASKGITFNSKSELYAAMSFPEPTKLVNEVMVYEPVNVAELIPGKLSCKPGVENATSWDVTLACSLNGEVNPWGVPKTEEWFEWGRTPSLGEKTPVQPIEGPPPDEVPILVSAEVAAVRPNEAGFYFQLAAFDANVPPSEPEPLTSEPVSQQTPITAPRIKGDPSASFVTSSSAVMFSELNPENARTMYEFQYARAGACEKREEEVAHKVEVSECPEVFSTPAAESHQYGKIGTTVEVSGLQPATVYRYRLLAENESNNKSEKLASTGEEGSLMTAAAPVVQAVTGAYGSVGANSATISGTVNADGRPAAYAFELGVYNGASTQYGIVFSGAAGASSTPVQESLALTGLQPGTTYAYRIVVKSGYGVAEGASMTFTTAGLPSVLSLPPVLGMLAVPNIAFPRPATSTTKALTNAQKLAKALTACKKRSRKQRAACQKQAHKHYPKSKQANNRKKG